MNTNELNVYCMNELLSDHIAGLKYHYGTIRKNLIKAKSDRKKYIKFLFWVNHIIDKVNCLLLEDFSSYDHFDLTVKKSLDKKSYKVFQDIADIYKIKSIFGFSNKDRIDIINEIVNRILVIKSDHELYQLLKEVKKNDV